MKYIACVLLIITCSLASAQSDRLLIGAASDLKFALDSVVSAYSKSHPGKVDVTYGSSGKLFEQISNGAPFELFFSADVSYPKQLQEKGLTASDLYSYGVGRIVLWSKTMGVQKGGMEMLRSPSIQKIAIANPLHAPYGKRAQEALAYYKLLDLVKDKLVYGENISQTAQFVTTGAADVGIVALSLAVSPAMKKEGGQYYLIPEVSHSVLEQGVVITAKGKENKMARSFLDFMKGDDANKILAYFGFTKP